MPVQLIDIRGHRQEIGDLIDQAMADVVEHAGFIMGPEVAELERDLADYCRVGHVVSCSNGTDALMLALMAAGLEPGDAVIVPTFTFVATAEAVSVLGGVPVFADSLKGGFNICPRSAAEAGAAAQAAGLRVRAIVAVDLFGHAADYEALRPVAHELGATLIADAAQSLGADTPRGSCGALADITTTSFFPAKPLGCYGDGGAVFTDDEEVAERLRSLRIHGKGTFKYDNVRVGLNARLDTLQAAVLIEKLRIFDNEIKSRNDIAARYASALSDRTTVPTVEPGEVPTWAQYTLEVADRDGLQAHLQQREIGCAIYYPTPLHRQTAYTTTASMSPVGLERAEYLAEHVLSIPMHAYLSEVDQELVITEVNAFVDG